MQFPRDTAKFRARLLRVGSCLEWQGARTGSGYGNLVANGVHTNAHRIAWQLDKGEIPRGLFVLHKCDNRPCCNPEHLFLGSWRENALDMVAKGRGPWDTSRKALLRAARKRRGVPNPKPAGWKYRGPRGERHGNAKLTDAQIVEIRTKWIPHKGPAASRGLITQAALAREYGVSLSLIEKLCRGVCRRTKGSVR